MPAIKANGVSNGVHVEKEDSLDVERVLAALSTLEKINLLSGADNWHTFPLPKHGVPAARVMSDGPNGCRGQFMFNGVPSSCFPCSTGIAATFDVNLVSSIASALGDECISKGSHILLAPTVNIPRSPLGGRGFESFSEDPYLSGIMASAYINSLQSKGVAATIKHFVNGDQETDRKTFSAEVSDRAQREIYMKPFQMAIKKSNPRALMTSYNRVNGLHASESELLIDTILRKEWGYQGLVMSDWSGTYSCTKSILAGLDLEMPGPSTVRGLAAFRAVVAGKLTINDLDERARQVLKLVKSAQLSGIPFGVEENAVDTPELRKILRKSAAETVVLLKNEAKLLPLGSTDRPIKSIAVVGYNASIAVTSGGGAADLLPSYKVTPLEGIRAAAENYFGLDPGQVKYAIGAPTFRFVPLIDRYLSIGEGSQRRTAGRVEFWNEPGENLQMPTSSAIFVTETRRAEMRLNDNIPDTVNQTCWYRYSGTFTPDEDGDWEFSLVVAGQGNLYIDDALVVDNTTNQTLGTYFLAQGSVEEKGTVRGMKAGQGYKFEVRATNEIALNNTSPYKTRGALRVGAWKPVSDQKALEDAVDIASVADVAIVVVGLTSESEAEGFDRPDMRIPGNGDALVEAIITANPNTVVITQSGTPLEMPWLEKASTVLHAFYGGNDLGGGLADVLFGQVNPSAKLPLSWPKTLSDSPSYTSFGGENKKVLYNEGVYVGYRHPKCEVSFPFGHGLSYTTFSYSSLICPSEIRVGTLLLSFVIKNTGSVAGSEAAQVYVSDPECSVGRPPLELKGFVKVHLEPGEEKRVNVDLDRDAWAFWSEEKAKWVAEKGEFGLHIGSSSRDIRLKTSAVLRNDIEWVGL